MKYVLSLILFVVLTTNVFSQTKYTVKEGKHDFTPNHIQLKTDGFVVEYECVFYDVSKYILPNEDQLDWNKGAGWTNHILTNTKNSAMWGWRWNPTIDLFEITGYFHRDNKALYAENNFGGKTFKVTVGEYFYVRFIKNIAGDDFYRVIIHNKNNTKYLTYEVQYDQLKCCDRNIGSWFGGNQSAPNTISIFWKTY